MGGVAGAPARRFDSGEVSLPGQTIEELPAKPEKPRKTTIFQQTAARFGHSPSTTEVAEGPPGPRKASSFATKNKSSSDLSEVGNRKASSVMNPTQQPRGVFSSIDPQAMKEKIRMDMAKPQYDVANFYWETGVWQAIARNGLFEKMTLSVIAFNAMWIGVDTDWNNAEVLLQAEPVFQIVEHGFCCYFSFEWFVRFMSFKRKRNGCRDAWFVFDTTLVGMMVLETWVMTTVIVAAGGGGSTPLGNASILRMARLLRLSRMARMARLFRAMPELLIMIKGMVAASRSVFFTLLLLLIITYIFAIAFTQLLEGIEELAEKWGSVGSSMHTLWLDGTLLDGAGDVVANLKEASYVYVAIFYLFVLISAMTVMNMLIGVLCEVVSGVAEAEKEKLSVAFVRSCLEKAMVGGGIDKDADGNISKAEFAAILQNRKACHALGEVGVDVFVLVDNIDTIFAPEENDEDEWDDDSTKMKERTLTFEEFMELVLQLRGSNTATVKDIVDLRKVLTSMERRMKDSMKTHLRPMSRAPSRANMAVGHTASVPSVPSECMHSDVVRTTTSTSKNACIVEEVSQPHVTWTSSTKQTTTPCLKPPSGEAETQVGSAHAVQAHTESLAERRRNLMESLASTQAHLHRFIDSLPLSSDAAASVREDAGFAPSGPPPAVAEKAGDFLSDMYCLQDSVTLALRKLQGAHDWLEANDRRAPKFLGGSHPKQNAIRFQASSSEKPWSSPQDAAGGGDVPSSRERWHPRRPSLNPLDVEPGVIEEVMRASRSGTFPKQGDLADVFRVARRRGLDTIADTASRRMLEQLTPNKVVAWAAALFPDAEAGDAKARALVDDIYTAVSLEPSQLRGAMERRIRDTLVAKQVCDESIQSELARMSRNWQRAQTAPQGVDSIFDEQLA